MTAHTAIKLPAQNLEPMAFAPYGEIIRQRASSVETSIEDVKLILNGTPRLWIMDLKKRGLVFADMARHRRVTQCLGSMLGKEWFIGVAPPNDLADGARPELDRIAAFRIPGDCVIKLHVGTWHAGPHFVHDECLFFNLENIDTNERDFDTSELPNEIKFKYDEAPCHQRARTIPQIAALRLALHAHFAVFPREAIGLTLWRELTPPPGALRKNSVRYQDIWRTRASPAQQHRHRRALTGTRASSQPAHRRRWRIWWRLSRSAFKTVDYLLRAT